MKRKGFGAIDLLVGLIVMAAIFLMCKNTFKSVSVTEKPADVKSIKEHIDQTVNEIEDMRKQSQDYQINQEF